MNVDVRLAFCLHIQRLAKKVKKRKIIYLVTWELFCLLIVLCMFVFHGMTLDVSVEQDLFAGSGSG